MAFAAIQFAIDAGFRSVILEGINLTAINLLKWDVNTLESNKLVNYVVFVFIFMSLLSSKKAIMLLIFLLNLPRMLITIWFG